MAQCSSLLRLRHWSRCTLQCRTAALTPAKKPMQRTSVSTNVAPSVATQLRSRQLPVAAAQEDVQPVPDLLIPASDLECDRKWISGMIAMWLDEEWTPLEVHKELGQAAGDAYVKCRQHGDDDVSSLVLSISNELLSFNYRETFTNAFEVGNKVVEMLMMRSGVDVCCTTEDDAARMQRFAASQDESSRGGP